jgi:NTP pyrophosphatase (non-canonical NTP hydrolase)
MDWAVFQQEVGDWSRKNFPNNTAMNPLLGLAEEIGELAEATAMGNFDKITDSIGDIMVYMADYCSRRDGFNLASMTSNRTVLPYRSFDITGIVIEQGKLFRAVLKAQQGIRGLSDEHTTREKLALIAIIVHVRDYQQSVSFEEVVELTWGKVKQRDWQKDKKTGGDLDAVTEQSK